MAADLIIIIIIITITIIIIVVLITRPEQLDISSKSINHNQNHYQLSVCSEQKFILYVYVENYKISFDGSPVSIAHNNINFCIQDPNHPTKKLLIYRDNLLWYDRLLDHIGKF